MPKPKVLLFDLGGVLIENTAFADLPTLLSEPITAASLADRWLDSRAVQAFERGEIEAEEFGARFVDEWGLRISRDEFLARFETWPRGPYDGALEMLVHLRRDYTTACLTNCNALHWRRLQPLLAQLDHAFSSHLMGLVKPDPAIFRRVVDALGCDAADICFFDDSARNVDAARAAGMSAEHVAGFGELSRRLCRLGLAGFR